MRGRLARSHPPIRAGEARGLRLAPDHPLHPKRDQAEIHARPLTENGAGEDGGPVGLNETPTDEFCAMRIIAEERDSYAGYLNR